MSTILLEMEVEEGAEVDRCDDTCSIGGLVELCGWDSQPGCTFFAALLWVWGHGGTFWQQALCTFLQCPVLWRPNHLCLLQQTLELLLKDHFARSHIRCHTDLLCTLDESCLIATATCY